MEAYDYRVIAYADILGWECACNDTSKYSLLKSAAHLIKDYADKFSQEIKEFLSTSRVPNAFVAQHAGVEFSFFSDNFVVSAPTNQVEGIFKILAFTNDMLLRNKFLLRGGVTIGYVHHKDNVVFGPALNEVVCLERKKAKYPRILCSQTLVNYINPTPETPKHFLFQDCYTDWVVNTACGNDLALQDLLLIMEKEISTLQVQKDKEKWNYLQKMLPEMYRHKGSLN